MDQLLNKMDDLAMLIAAREPDIMLFTELIPKAQRHPIQETQVKLKGCDIYTNFNYTDGNLGTSGNRGVAIYVKDNIKCDEVKLKNEYADQVWVEQGSRNKDHLLCGSIYRIPPRARVSTIETTKVYGTKRPYKEKVLIFNMWRI